MKNKLEDKIREIAENLGLFNISKESYDLKAVSTSFSNNLEFLYEILREELYLRETKSREKRWSRSRLDREKTFENYDLKEGHGIKEDRIFAIKDFDWVQQKSNIILKGPTGTGKTHIANAIGNLAIIEGYKVQFFQFDLFLQRIVNADRNATKIEYMKECDIIIIDEVGYLPIEEEEAKAFFKIVNELNASVSIVITTNLDLSLIHI